MGKNWYDRERDGRLYYRALDAVQRDDKHKFVRLFNRLSLHSKENILSGISTRDAANCLAAIFDGEAGDGSTLTYYVSDVEKNIPLHYAARTDRSRVALLLLDKGFSADLRTDFNSPYICLKNALPLNVSLDYARFNLWTFYRGTSPIHQIIRSCTWTSYPNIIRILARNTKEIKHEFFKYLKQGKVFEVGSLLAIASDIIMSSSSTVDGENGTVDGENGSVGFKNIMEMRQFLLAEMSRSLNGASNTQLKEMKKTLRLLEIFDKVEDELVAHTPMWDDYEDAEIKVEFEFQEDAGIKIASLIKDAAYDEEEKVEYDPDAVPSAYLHGHHVRF